MTYNSEGQKHLDLLLHVELDDAGEVVHRQHRKRLLYLYACDMGTTDTLLGTRKQKVFAR